MSDSLFEALPPELICGVFKCADDFSAVAALAQTARIFYGTWRQNPTSICRAVASRVILNPIDAEQLLDMQEAAESMSQSQDDRLQKSIIRAKRLQFNARCASNAVKSWECFCQQYDWPGREYTYMRRSELARFEHAFYCVWAIGVMGNTPHLQDRASAFLDTCSPRELFRLDELGQWAYEYTLTDFGPSGFEMHGEVWNTGIDLVSKRWGDYIYVGPSLPQIPVIASSRLDFYAFFDHTQQYLEYIPDK